MHLVGGGGNHRSLQKLRRNHIQYMYQQMSTDTRPRSYLTHSWQADQWQRGSREADRQVCTVTTEMKCVNTWKRQGQCLQSFCYSSVWVLQQWFPVRLHHTLWHGCDTPTHVTATSRWQEALSSGCFIYPTTKLTRKNPAFTENKANIWLPWQN